jgi:lon-related putative ATP-dependent protease
MAQSAAPIQSLLTSDALARRCDPAKLGFETTAELEASSAGLGQERAREAIELALEMPHLGYNSFVAGPSGHGKHAFVTQLLEGAAAEREVPNDWCYVYDFEKPEHAVALALPTGRAQALKRSLAKMVEELCAAIPAAFESEAYRNRMQQIEAEFRAFPERAFAEVEREAEKYDIRLERMPNGIAFAPLRNGQVLTPDDFQKLSRAEQERTRNHIRELQEKLESELSGLPRLAKLTHEKMREVNREVTHAAVAQTLEELKREFADLPHVVAYLELVQVDVVDNADDFRREREKSNRSTSSEVDSAFRRYGVNVMVDHQGSSGAPVVYEDRPTADRLVGRVEHRVVFGNLVSDFTLIKPGALHSANGGYLVLDARQLLLSAYAWDALKRALYSREVRIESLSQMLGLSSVSTLEPAPIPLDVKVVLVGDRLLYNLLCELDSDVSELFKVLADLDDDVDRDDASEAEYARLIATATRRENLLPFDCRAVARLVDEAARDAGDSRKLSTRLRGLVDLLREASHIAARETADRVSATHVLGALAARQRRTDRPRRLLREAVLRDTLLIDTSGERVGQVNGLSVSGFAGESFGQPTRITATARVGDGKVIDIEREVELGGPLHSKGVLILTSWLASRYTRQVPLSLSASLVFEQCYGGVEGDSASLAELCGLLSTLANAPLRQSVAVTGSVNQLGRVQPVGAVNEKIEGFFEVCLARGLSGEQGVIIPRANVPHLMLRDDVIEATQNQLFHVWAVDTVDEAFEVLTGQPAGVADENGNYPEGTLNQRVMQQLLEFAVTAENFEKMVTIETE